MNGRPSNQDLSELLNLQSRDPDRSGSRQAGDVTLSVVLPAHNEADHLSDSVRHIRSVLVGLDVSFEIIVIDDGSRDETWAVVQSLAADFPEMRGASLSRNFGKEAAVRAGLALTRGEAVVVMDCDLQHPPELIPRLLDLWRHEAYLVVNAVKEDRGNEPRVIRWGARLFYYTFERLSGLSFENSSDFKLLDRKVVRAYLGLPETNLFFRGLVRWVGFQQVDVPFRVAPRAGGRSKWSLVKLACLAADSVIAFSTAPLRLVTLSGLLFLLFAVIVGVQTLAVHFSGGAVEGFTTVILLTLIVSSLLMLSLGIIGEYIARIYHEVKGRPRYFLQDVIAPRQTASSTETGLSLQAPASAGAPT